MQFAQYVFPLLTFPYLTRVLGPENYGVMAFVVATISFLQMFVDFGFMLSATKDVAENRTNKESIGEIVGLVINSKLLLSFVALIALTIMVVLVPMLRANVIFTYLYFVSVVLSILLPDFLFRGIEKMSILTIRYVFSKTITTALVFVVIKSSDDMVLIPILNIIGSIVAVILTWIEIVYHLKIKVVFKPIKESFRIIENSFVYFISTIATTVFGVINTIMLGMFAPADQVAFWATSFMLISTAQSLYSPIITSIYPHMVTKKDFRFVRLILMTLMPLIIITTTGVYIFAKPIIVLLCGDQYVQAIPVFKALSPLLILSFPVMLIGFPVLGIMGKVKETSMSTISSAIFHFTGLILLLLTNKFTIINVAILRSVTEGFLLLIRTLLILKYRKKYHNL